MISRLRTESLVTECSSWISFNKVSKLHGTLVAVCMYLVSLYKQLFHHYSLSPFWIQFFPNLLFQQAYEEDESLFLNFYLNQKKQSKECVVIYILQIHFYDYVLSDPSCIREKRKCTPSNTPVIPTDISITHVKGERKDN